MIKFPYWAKDIGLALTFKLVLLLILIIFLKSQTQPIAGEMQTRLEQHLLASQPQELSE